jgi:hypothetical protein
LPPLILLELQLYDEKMGLAKIRSPLSISTLIKMNPDLSDQFPALHAATAICNGIPILRSRAPWCAGPPESNWLATQIDVCPLVSAFVSEQIL